MAEISSEDRAAVEKDTKARIKGIMTHEEAKGREALAEHLAYETDNTVEQAAAPTLEEAVAAARALQAGGLPPAAAAKQAAAGTPFSKGEIYKELIK